MKYQFIEQHKHTFPVVVMCRVLGVSESGYDAWRKRPECSRKREDARLSTHMQQVFTTCRGVYGSPRIHAELKEQGWRCSRHPDCPTHAGEWDECQTQSPSPHHNEEASRACGCSQSPPARFYSRTPQSKVDRRSYVHSNCRELAVSAGHPG